MLLPDYSVYAGTPSHVAAQRVRANAPGFVAENELKMDILKRQHICLAQVRTGNQSCYERPYPLHLGFHILPS